MYNLFPISPHTNSVNMMNFTWCIAYCTLTIFKTTVQVSAYIICNIKQSISCSDILVETKIYQIAYEISCYAFFAIRQRKVFNAKFTAKIKLEIFFNPFGIISAPKCYISDDCVYFSSLFGRNRASVNNSEFNFMYLFLCKFSADTLMRSYY